MLALTLCSLLLLTCVEQGRLTFGRKKISLVALIKEGKSEVFTIPFDRYAGDIRALPIGVFDSGIGGLTVLEAILEMDAYNNVTGEPGPDGRPDFEKERFVYLGDQANMPYGNYPSEKKIDFLRELILKDVVFLLGERYWPSADAELPRYDKPPVKAVVIACNTATAYGLDDVQNALEQWDLPVHLVGVVQAGADGAIQSMVESGDKGSIAVLATVGTCKSNGYVQAVKKSAEEAGIEPPTVIQQGCLGLAGAIEGDPSYITTPGAAATADYRGPAVGNKAAPIEPALIAQYGFENKGLLGEVDRPVTWRLNSVENYIRYHTTSLVDRYRRGGATEPISVVILGCTHFPYYMDKIKASFERLRGFGNNDGSMPYKMLILEQISFIDPAELTAGRLYESLADAGLLIDGRYESILTTDEFYISVPNVSLVDVKLSADGGFTYEYKYGRAAGDFSVEYVRRVPMSRANLSYAVRESIKENMPTVWRRLVTFSQRSPRTMGLPMSARIMPNN